MATQLQLAQAGKITREISFVAEQEGLDAELIRKELAAGRLVIPANIKRLKTNLKPTGIGRILTTKINANIGTSSVSSTIEAEIEKMQSALSAGADAIMDLSTGPNLDQTRPSLAKLVLPIFSVTIERKPRGRCATVPPRFHS